MPGQQAAAVSHPQSAHLAPPDTPAPLALTRTLQAAGYAEAPQTRPVGAAAADRPLSAPREAAAWLAQASPAQTSPLIFTTVPPPALVRVTRHKVRPGALLSRSAPEAAEPVEEEASCEDGRPVAVDLWPARLPLACWRLDDTRAFVRGPDAEGRAASLFARLMDAGGEPNAVKPGEGVETWAGSPLWLRWAGISKPPALGIALNEGRAPRLRLTRLAAAWRVELDGLERQVAADDPDLTAALLYGVTDRVEPQLSGWPALWRGARASATAEAQEWRAREAWAALARDHARLWRQRAPVPITAPSADALRRRGIAALVRVAEGNLDAIGRLEGAAIAVALGRLPADAAAFLFSPSLG